MKDKETAIKDLQKHNKRLFELALTKRYDVIRYTKRCHRLLLWIEHCNKTW